MKHRAVTLENLSQEYLETIKSSKSPSTYLEYSHCVNRFVGLFKTKNINEVSDTDIESLVEYLNLNPEKDNSKNIHRHLQKLLYMFNYAELQGYKFKLDTSWLSTRVKKMYKEIHTKHYQNAYLSDYQVNKLARYWKRDNEKDTMLNLRNRVIFGLFADTGLKTEELMSLHREDYINGKVLIGLRGNASVTRKVPLSNATNKLVNLYLNMRNSGPYSDSAPDIVIGYTSLEPDRIKTHPLSVRQIQRIVKDTSLEVNLKDYANPKTLRASRIAKALVEDSEDKTLKDTLDSLGYKGPTAYQRYLPKAKELAGITKSHKETSELAIKLGVKADKLARLCKAEKIPCIKFRKRFYIDLSKISEQKIYDITK